jgi:hypothetical protein
MNLPPFQEGNPYLLVPTPTTTTPKTDLCFLFLLLSSYLINKFKYISSPPHSPLIIIHSEHLPLSSHHFTLEYLASNPHDLCWLDYILRSLLFHNTLASFLSHLFQLFMMPRSTIPHLTNIIIILSFSHSFMSHALRKKEQRLATILSLHSSMEMSSSFS